MKIRNKRTGKVKTGEILDDSDSLIMSFKEGESTILLLKSGWEVVDDDFDVGKRLNIIVH